MTRVRAMRVMMETSPREEGDDGRNNQLGNKAAATPRTVVATTARATTMAARATVTGAKRMTATMATAATMATMATMAMMATMATMMPNGDDDNKNQVATTARVMTMVARAMVTGANRATATMATTATTATTVTTAMMEAMLTLTTMMPNSNDAASDDEGNKDTKQ